MPYDSFKHHRRSIRLKEYDYTRAGVYYITLVVHNRECLFGHVVDGEMRLNEIGSIVAEEWARSSEIRKEIELDERVVMPNHLHGIIVITGVGARGNAGAQDGVGARDAVGAHGRAPLHRKPRSVGSFVAGFESAATTRINEMRDTQGAPVWQANYHEHIIRDDADLDRIRKYIIDNPANWDSDDENPNTSRKP